MRNTVWLTAGLGLLAAAVTVPVAAAPKTPPAAVTLCHKPGTPAEKTLTLPSSAVPGHLGHGDTLGACGGGGGELCGPPPPAPPNPDPTQPSDYEGPSSSARVTLEGASATGFVAAGAPITFRLSCPTLDPAPDGLTVYDNVTPIPDASLVLTSDSITIPGLSSGRHDVFVAARDTFGAPIISNVVLWAGSTSIPVLVLSETGAAVSGATVTLSLGDDANVSATLTTNAAGQGTFTNLPDRSYNIVATTADNRIGFKPHSFIDGTAVIRLRGFDAPSPIDNNDFSQGTQGWNVGNEYVTIVPHVEGSPGGFLAAALSPQATAAPGPAPLRTLADSERAGAAVARTPVVGPAFPGVAPDFDLQLATQGEGPRTISRTFNVEPGNAAVRVRFRFITSEIPGGYFGTQFNDFYNVSIRTQTAGGAINAGNSMNNLGLAAFDPGGATGWYEAELPVDENGDTVQVDLSVANVADGLFDSWLVADAVKVSSLRIDAVQLLDIDNTALDYISAAQHTYFGGNVRFHGTITLRGPADATLSTLTLRIKRGGSSIGSGSIPTALQATLLTAFGSDQTIRITSPQLLFEVPSSSLGSGHDSNENLTLQVFAATAAGDFVERDVLTKPRLTRYGNTNRYGGRDENRGGDDWVKPGARAIIGQVGSAEWGDFSNMHAGSFAPDHSSHRTGNSADGWFTGYNNRDAGVAQRLIDIINQLGDRWTLAVTFQLAS